MPKPPRGLRCPICGHLIATTRPWVVVSTPRSSRLLCHECGDDLQSFLRTLEREHATGRRKPRIRRAAKPSLKFEYEEVPA